MTDITEGQVHTAGHSPSVGEARSRLALVALLVGAGIIHLVAPRVYEQIVPKWAGNPRRVVLASGIVEIMVGVMLTVPPTRRLAAWLALVLFVAVYPANIKMALDAGRPHDAISWAAWARLPLQFPLIAWAYRHTH